MEMDMDLKVSTNNDPQTGAVGGGGDGPKPAMEVNGTNTPSDLCKGDAETREEPMSVNVEVDEYFANYEDLNIHRLMLEDTVRTNAYLNAINTAAILFKDKIVMDVGAGTGILSLFCAKAGAKKVYSVEASNLAKILPDVAADNQFADIITVINSRVEDVKEIPDDKVDIIVSEWMGFYLLHESMLDSVIHARDKFLKPGGLMFPNTAQIYAAPCSASKLRNDNIEYWCSKNSHYGMDLSRFGRIAKKLVEPLIETISTEDLLADPQLLFDINLQSISGDALKIFKDRRFFSIEQNGQMHAVCLWFTCTFPVAPNSEPIELCTAPWSEQTHWKQTVILLPEKLDYEEGDIMGWEIRFEKAEDGKNCRAYTIEYQTLDVDDEHPVPCECGLAKCEIIKAYMGQQVS